MIYQNCGELFHHYKRVQHAKSHQRLFYIIQLFYSSTQDEYGNCTGLGYSGKVNVEILGPSDISEIPTFVGGFTTISFTLSNGSCQINVSVHDQIIKLYFSIFFRGLQHLRALHSIIGAIIEIKFKNLQTENSVIWILLAKNGGIHWLVSP